MNGECYIKSADASGDIWLIFDPSGVTIGACSAREVALRIADIANSRIAIPKSRKVEELNPTNSAGTSIVKTATIRPVMFDWYAPRRRETVWSLLRRCYRYVRQREWA